MNYRCQMLHTANGDGCRHYGRAVLCGSGIKVVQRNVHIEELLGNLHQQAVPCIGNDFQSGFKFLFWFADPVSGYPTLGFFRSGKIFGTLLHSRLWMDTPKPLVMKPMISSPGNGLQHFASLVKQFSIPSTKMPLPLYLARDSLVIGFPESACSLTASFSFRLAYSSLNARQKVAQCNAAVANGTE